MVPKFDPWNPPNHGSPRDGNPAFQREWKGLSSSAVVILGTEGIGHEQTVVKATSSEGVSGTIYIWGVAATTATNNAQAIKLKDDAGTELLTVVCSRNGPYFLQLTTPLKIIDNSKIIAEVLSPLGDDLYVTVLHTSTNFNYE